MKIKKILLIIFIIICLVGCTNINNLSYDEIVNNFSEKGKNANVYKKGYQYYVPSGLISESAGNGRTR